MILSLKKVDPTLRKQSAENAAVSVKKPSKNKLNIGDKI